MSMDFLSVVNAHRTKYPLMKPQDYTKLAYQSEFGPEHFVRDMPQVEKSILGEWGAVLKNGPQPPEPVGNGLCRFHLTTDYIPSQAAPLLSKLFSKTVREHKGLLDHLLVRLEQLRQLQIPDMESWLINYRNQKYPSVHHSETFRQTYHPHYRLLKTEYAGYFPALLAIWRRLQTGERSIVAIDGQCGSGKTHFSALISELFPCNIVHMDDFYLPVNQRYADWLKLPGANMDLLRFRDEILLPARSGQQLIYRPFDCRTGSQKPSSVLPAQLLTVVEGSYSHHPLLDSQYDLKIFLTCSKQEQLIRLATREGEHFPAFTDIWSPLEEQYFQHYSVKEHSDIVIDTSNLFE